MFIWKGLIDKGGFMSDLTSEIFADFNEVGHSACLIYLYLYSLPSIGGLLNITNSDVTEGMPGMSQATYFRGRDALIKAGWIVREGKKIRLIKGYKVYQFDKQITQNENFVNSEDSQFDKQVTQIDKEVTQNENFQKDKVYQIDKQVDQNENFADSENSQIDKEVTQFDKQIDQIDKFQNHAYKEVLNNKNIKNNNYSSSDPSEISSDGQASGVAANRSKPSSGNPKINPPPETKIWLDAVAQIIGSKDSTTMANQRKWVSVCQSAMRDGFNIAELLAAITTYRNSLNGKLQYFTPDKCLEQLQLSRSAKKQQENYDPVLAQTGRRLGEFSR